MSKAFFVVIGDEGQSWSDKLDAAETFSSLAVAEKRAMELAATSPGDRFRVCQCVSEAYAEVSAPTILRMK